MAIIGAAIAAAASLGGGALASSGGKKAGKANQGEAMLAKIATQLFSETGPLRETTIGQAMSALTTGQPSAVGSALAQTDVSNIEAQGSRQRQRTQDQFAHAGLASSSVAIQAQEDIDRAIANLITSARGADVRALTELGRSIGFGQVPGQAIASSGALANLQQQQSLFNQREAGAFGSSSGALIGQILQKYLTSSSSGSGSLAGGANVLSQFNTDPYAGIFNPNLA